LGNILSPEHLGGAFMGDGGEFLLGYGSNTAESFVAVSATFQTREVRPFKAKKRERFLIGVFLNRT